MKNLLKKFEEMMSAAAFAEAGEHETAREILRKQTRKEKKKQDRPVQRVSKRMKA
jgi:ribosomal protein L12E/L44/L45/RPP1/RPP2